LRSAPRHAAISVIAIGGAVKRRAKRGLKTSPTIIKVTAITRRPLTPSALALSGVGTAVEDEAKTAEAGFGDSDGEG
jgi:hypothetical protein